MMLDAYNHLNGKSLTEDSITGHRGTSDSKDEWIGGDELGRQLNYLNINQKNPKFTFIILCLS